MNKNIFFQLTALAVTFFVLIGFSYSDESFELCRMETGVLDVRESQRIVYFWPSISRAAIQGISREVDDRS